MREYAVWVSVRAFVHACMREYVCFRVCMRAYVHACICRMGEFACLCACVHA